jgi:NHL repeat.
MRAPVRSLLALATLAALTACSAPVAETVGNPADGQVEAATIQPDAASVARITEAFLTPMTPDDNIDSPASWQAADGSLWLIATAKATDKLVVYDGQTGAHLRDVGTAGAGPGQFDRPNGIAVIDDLVLVVERDNRRVQVMTLPDFTPIGHFRPGRAAQALWPVGQQDRAGQLRPVCDRFLGQRRGCAGQ